MLSSPKAHSAFLEVNGLHSLIEMSGATSVHLSLYIADIFVYLCNAGSLPASFLYTSFATESSNQIIRQLLRGPTFWRLFSISASLAKWWVLDRHTNPEVGAHVIGQELRYAGTALLLNLATLSRAFAKMAFCETSF